MKLAGRVAIVTGSGRGLGKAVALEMAKEGADVVILSRSYDEVKAIAERVKGMGRRVISERVDVSSEKDVRIIVERATSEFGHIDILVNNAAIVGPVTELFHLGENDWDYVMGINLKGVFLFSKNVIPVMIKNKRGKIINITSGLGNIVMPRFGVYSVSKAAVSHLTRIMAEELKNYNIQVNAVDPGVMDTSMQEQLRKLGPDVLGSELHTKFVELKEKGLLKSPEKIAKLVVFLSSDDSDGITGHIGGEAYYRTLGYK